MLLIYSSNNPLCHHLNANLLQLDNFLVKMRMLWMNSDEGNGIYLTKQ